MIRRDTGGPDGKPGAPAGGSGRNPREQRESVSKVTARRDDSTQGTKQWMEAVVERENMSAALYRVETNAGSAGVDKISVDGLRG
jgi:hypothetical protein